MIAGPNRIKSNPFADRHKFKDDVWGQVNLNDLERDVIDTPEFQRLFRTSQLGFVDLVYQTANHTRGAHSIGACHLVAKLMDHLSENSRRLCEVDDRFARIEISEAERVLIRVGALLHDISHVPLSHDLEQKAHRIKFLRKHVDPSGHGARVTSHYGYYAKPRSTGKVR